MIFIKVEAMPGMSHEEWATECLSLARRLGVGVEIKANRVGVNVFPNDTVPEIIGRYHMLAKIQQG